MRLLFAAVFAACNHTPPATVSLALPLPTSPITPVSEKRALAQPPEMDFSSDQGAVHLVKDGDRFAGTLPGGVLTCTARADTFTCHWYKASAEGTAKLRREGDHLSGEWDSEEADEETIERGAFTGTLDGAWSSNWGDATVTTTGQSVHFDYGDGTVDCTAHDRKLACTWQESGTTGAAELVVESQRVVRGRWGTGSSASDGGDWVFVRR